MRGLNVFLLLFLLYSLACPGQINKFGIPLHSSYSVELSGGAEYNHCMTKDRNGVVYFGNDGRGVIRYDGAKWDLISINAQRPLYAIESDDNNIIYLGGDVEFGYIAPSQNGELSYTSLSESFRERFDTIVDFRTVWAILVKDDRVIYAGSRALFTYFPAYDSLSYINMADLGHRNVLNITSVGDRIFVMDNISGILEMKDDSVFPAPGGNFFSRMRTPYR